MCRLPISLSPIVELIRTAPVYFWPLPLQLGQVTLPVFLQLMQPLPLHFGQSIKPVVAHAGHFMVIPSSSWSLRRAAGIARLNVDESDGIRIHRNCHGHRCVTG